MPYAVPMARPDVSAGNALVSTLTDTGKISAAPRPCRPRNAMIAPALGATAHSTDATPNSAIPTSRVGRRPRMSPRRPAGTMNAPSTNM